MPLARGLVTGLPLRHVMTGTSIDQILAHPSDPRIYEPVVSDARTYVQLAEEVNGPSRAGRAVVHLGRCSG